MAKWAEGLKSKLGKLVTESSVSKKEGLYGKKQKPLGFDTSTLTDDEIDTIGCEVTNITNKEVDDGCYLTITFKSGAVAFVEVGTYNFIALPRFYMKAEKGSALITDWREKTKVAKCKYWHENDVLPVQTAAGLTKTMAPRDSVTLDEYELEIPKSDVHDFYRNFCKAIDGEATQLVTHDQMLLDMKIMEYAFKSAELGQTLKFE